MSMINVNRLRDHADFYSMSGKPIGMDAKLITLSMLDLIIQTLAVDAVEVVRCKDCKHSSGVYATCRHVDWWNRGDDYCSRGERKEQHENF